MEERRFSAASAQVTQPQPSRDCHNLGSRDHNAGATVEERRFSAASSGEKIWALAPEKLAMSMNSKKSLTSTTLLILLGVGALAAGEKWLIVLIPAAIFVWYSAGSILGTGRN